MGERYASKELINFDELMKGYAGRQKKHESIVNSAQKIIDEFDEFDEYYGNMESSESSSDAGR